MGGYLYEELRGPKAMNRVWHGVVANNVGDISDRLEVTIPDLDPDLRIKNCRWQSRDGVSLPIRGNDCLVLFDNNKEAWVVCWWPF